MSIILGICAGDHDGSLALVKEGKLVGAMSRERFTRIKKHHNGNNKDFILFFLGLHNLSIQDITCVTFNDIYGGGAEDYIEFFENKKRVINDSGSLMWLKDSFKQFVARIDGFEVPAFQVHHHLSHCAYVFYTSNFDKAACLSLDASSDVSWTSSLAALGSDSKIDMIYCPDVHVGCMYTYFTFKLGLGSGLFKAGSLMGLASYGKPLDIALKKWKDFKKYDYGLVDDSQNKETDSLIRSLNNYHNYWLKLSGGVPSNHDQEFFAKDSEKAMDIAASVQYIFEQVILEAVNELYEKTKDYNKGNLCLSGGSFLNCNVNSLIKEKSKFKRVSVSPACGDEGIAAGSALYVAHNILGKNRVIYEPKDLVYLGGSYREVPEIGEPYNVEKVAKMLSEGKIVAWFQGRSEFGPRALGNRSLLADPTNPSMKDVLNARIKKREWFRPFAPSVLEEKSAEWFEFEDPSPFMLFTAKVKKPERIPAVTHVDNTARMQTVNKKDNPRYYELIEEFEKITGVPMILNTSLNINGEPIVETPRDAIRFLQTTDSDALVLENRLILKKDLQILD